MRTHRELQMAHERSVLLRMDVLARMIRERMHSEFWRRKSNEIVAGAQRPRTKLRSIYNFVQRSLRYTRDPAGVDVFYTAERALGNGMGDCDEQTQLVGILAKAQGMPVKLRAVSLKPGRFTHIYPLVKAGGKWTAADVTYGRGIDETVPDLRSMEVIV